MTDRTHPTDKETPMTLKTRHDELKALLNKISEESVTTSNVLADLLDLLNDRLPERTEVKVAPFDPDLIARNLEALKHAVSKPMREHGECCEPAEDEPERRVNVTITDAYAVPDRYGFLRINVGPESAVIDPEASNVTVTDVAPADDGLAEWERELLRPATCCGKCPPVAGGGYDCTCDGNPRCAKADTPEEWHAEPAPADDLPGEPVEPCGRDVGDATYCPCLLPRSHDGLHSCKHTEPAPADDLPGEPVEPGDLRAGDRVEFTWEGARFACTLVSVHDGIVLRSDTPDSDGFTTNVVWGREWASGISDVRLIERAPRVDEDRDEALARVEAERDALRERLDALRADVTRFHEMWGGGEIERLAKSDFAECLARDTERAAKGGQR